MLRLAGTYAQVGLASVPAEAGRDAGPTSLGSHSWEAMR